jgi:hypothetical protein
MSPGLIADDERLDRVVGAGNRSEPLRRSWLNRVVALVLVLFLAVGDDHDGRADEQRREWRRLERGKDCDFLRTCISLSLFPSFPHCPLGNLQPDILKVHLCSSKQGTIHYESGQFMALTHPLHRPTAILYIAPVFKSHFYKPKVCCSVCSCALE